MCPPNGLRPNIKHVDKRHAWKGVVTTEETAARLRIVPVVQHDLPVFLRNLLPNAIKIFAKEVAERDTPLDGFWLRQGCGGSRCDTKKQLILFNQWKKRILRRSGFFAIQTIIAFRSLIFAGRMPELGCLMDRKSEI